MRLRGFEIQGLAQLEHERVVFSDDAPNLIIGPNESGKTHLMLGLGGMFFGLGEPERMRPWSGRATMLGVLDFEDDDGQPVHLERNYLTDEVSVAANGKQWTATWDGKATNVERFLDSLEAWLGFRESAIFSATSFIRQLEMTDGEIKKVAPEIKRLITATVEKDYERTRRELTEALDGLRRSPATRKESRLERQQERLRQLEEERRTARDRQERITRLRQIRDAVAAEIEEKTRQESRLREQVDQVGAVDTLRSAQAKLQRELERVGGQLASLQRGSAALEESRRARDRYAAAAAADKNGLLALDRAVRDAEEGLERLGQPGNQPRALRARFLNKVKEATPTPDLTVEELTEQIWRAREARDAVLRSMGVVTIPQALDARERYERANAEVAKAESLLDALGDETDLVMKREEILRELDDVAEKLEGALPADRNTSQPPNREAFRRTLVSLQDEIAVLRNDHAEAERKLQAEGEGERDMAQLEREMETARGEIAESKRLITAHELALDALRTSVENFQDRYLEGVTTEASRLLSTLSAGRYTRVSLRDGDFEPLVDTPGRARIPNRHLGRGARDALYFALRVALSRALGGDRLPLILDDPYEHFDPAHLERTVETLHELSQRTQVVFFTSDPRYEAWFEPVLRLGEAAEVHSVVA